MCCVGYTIYVAKSNRFKSLKRLGKGNSSQCDISIARPVEIVRNGLDGEYSADN